MFLRARERLIERLAAAVATRLHACVVVAACCIAPTANAGLGYEVDDLASVRANAQLAFDAAVFDDTRTQPTASLELRRARVQLRLDDARSLFRFSGSYDAAPSSRGWKSAFVQYRGADGVRIDVGKLSPPTGITRTRGYEHSVHLAPSPVALLQPTTMPGVRVTFWDDSWSVAAGSFLEDTRLDLGERAEHGSAHVYALRATAQPWRNDTDWIHLGVAVNYRAGDDDYGVRLRQRGALPATRRVLLDTGRIRHIDDALQFSAETAAAFGRLMLVGEYSSLQVVRQNGERHAFSAWSAEAAVTILGAPPTYSVRAGAPRRRRTDASAGRLDGSVRIGKLAIGAANPRGGSAHAVSIAFDWQVSDSIRIGADATRYSLDARDDRIDDAHALGVRLLIAL